jgi:hypothetical protein
MRHASIFLAVKRVFISLRMVFIVRSQSTLLYASITAVEKGGRARRQAKKSERICHFSKPFSKSDNPIIRHWVLHLDRRVSKRWVLQAVRTS